MHFKTKKGDLIKLPKFTLNLAVLQDKIEQGELKTNVQIYTSVYDFLNTVFDAHTLAQELDGSTLDEVDLVHMFYVYKSICILYAGGNQPIVNHD